MKSRMAPVVFLPCCLAAIWGCGAEDGADMATVRWPVGLHVKAEGTVAVEMVSYKQTAGSEAVESSGTISSGEMAGQPMGTQRMTETTNFASEWLIVGETQLTPYVQAPPAILLTQEPQMLAVAEAVEIHNGTRTTDEVASGQSSGAPTGTTHHESPIAEWTKAYTIGLVGADYVQMVPNYDIYDGFSGVGEIWTDEAWLWNMTTSIAKRDARKGDFWTSSDLGTLYRVVDNEVLSFKADGKSPNAAVVEVRQAAGLDQKDIAGRCLSEQKESSAQQWLPPVDNFTDDSTDQTILHLDEG